MSEIDDLFTDSDKKELSAAEIAVLFDAATMHFESAAFSKVDEDVARIVAAKDGLNPVSLFDMGALREVIIALNVMEPLNELDALEQQDELVRGLLEAWTKEPLIVFATSLSVSGEKALPELIIAPGKLMTIHVRESLYNWDQILNVQDDGQPEFRTGYKEPFVVMHRIERMQDSTYAVSEETIYEIPIARIVALYKQ